jgi:low temperature requirement protein LtrA
MTVTGSAYEQQGGGDLVEQRVTSLELFFDLVFVFAISQVTGLLTDDTTRTGLLRGSALLGALWWAWVCYSWLTNAVRAENASAARLVILLALAEWTRRFEEPMQAHRRQALAGRV